MTMRKCDSRHCEFDDETTGSMCVTFQKRMSKNIVESQIQWFCPDCAKRRDEETSLDDYVEYGGAAFEESPGWGVPEILVQNSVSGTEKNTL